MEATISKNSTNEISVKPKKSFGNTVIFLILCALVVVFLAPILFILINFILCHLLLLFYPF